MILEHALLYVRAEQSAAFEAAMTRAKPLIAASPGFRALELRRRTDHTPGETDIYLLLVHWDDISSHQDSFRRSERYQQWRALLHGFYDPMPEVSYFEEPVIS